MSHDNLKTSTTSARKFKKAAMKIKPELGHASGHSPIAFRIRRSCRLLMNGGSFFPESIGAKLGPYPHSAGQPVLRQSQAAVSELGPA